MQNKAVVAVAGANKTQGIIDDALSDYSRRVLITTFTVENLKQIERRICDTAGYLPPHIELLQWYTFLLRDFVKPYQYDVFKQANLVRGLNFFGKRPYVKKSVVSRYYIDRNSDVYRDELAALAIATAEASGGLLTHRLEQRFDKILIDEMQDLSGWDFDVLELLFAADLSVDLVGDPRQQTYLTTQSNKNKGLKQLGWVDWLQQREDICEIETRSVSARCGPGICEFASGLYPELDPLKPETDWNTGHDGVILVHRDEVAAYVAKHNPTALRYDSRSDTSGVSAINIGIAKGSTYDRVLLFPAGTMRKHVVDGKTLAAGTRAKLYVAITRARYSAAIVV